MKEQVHQEPLRRRSMSAATPQPIPIPGNQGNTDEDRRRASRAVAVPVAATWGVSSTGHVYSDELRSPTQPSNSLTRAGSPGGVDRDPTELELDLPGPPALNRHQSRSADTGATLVARESSHEQQGSRLAQPSKHGPKMIPVDPLYSGGGTRSRSGSLSKSHGRPPQHVSSIFNKIQLAFTPLCC